MTPAMQNLAAEYALGLASGRDAERAARLWREDRSFRAEAAAWSARLAGLADDAEEREPSATLWQRIEQAIGDPPAANDNDRTLARQARMWRGAAAAMTALAACFALLLLFRPVQQVAIPAPQAPVQRASTPMVAMVGEDQDEMMIVANWDPAQRRLVLAVSGDMPPNPGKSHQIWVVPSEGGPTSLGVMPHDRMMRMDLAEQLADLLGQGATIAISLEPEGGSPTGQPTGPVMWSGKLQAT